MKLLRFLLPLIVVLACVGVASYLVATRPDPQMRQPPAMKLVVDAVRLKQQAYSVEIRSQGTVKPRTESTLIPEVSGRIVQISPAFRTGGFFESGDVLVTIDPSDYQAAVTVAAATLAQAEANLEIEMAQSAQALANWDRLGNGEEPSPLVLRKPQLAEATAKVASAKATLEKARRDFDRTRIKAPYAGRVLEQQVDVGQYVAPGTMLARVYAVDYVEIRLPLTNEDLAFLDLPEQYRGEQFSENRPKGPAVMLRGRVGGKEATWNGVIVRADGAIDTRSRQLFVVAQVDDPYGKTEPGRPPLKIGLFVEAEIEGRELDSVFVIPRSALRYGREVLIIDEAKTLRRREINLIWAGKDRVIVREGLEPGELLCVTPLAYAADGAAVDPKIEGEPNRAPDRQSDIGLPSGDASSAKLGADRDQES